MNRIQDIYQTNLKDGLTKTVSTQERIIQFGTGVLLRGLVDYIINEANEQDLFNGSVVMIKSTSGSPGDEFALQDNLYTVSVRGINKGTLQQQHKLNSSISRSINANTNWKEVLQLARQEEVDIIISNTTEAGIILDKADHYQNQPPVSYPGKLLAVLYERYTFFEADITKGYTIVPTELISNNGAELKKIILHLANINNCSEGFIQWIEEANTFCNSLVDRIVTGKPSPEKLKEHWQHLTYKDELLIECEPYLLWAIEGGEKVKEQLSFYRAVNGVVIEPSIEKYKELKMRLLNGTHTFMSGMAFLNGFEFVRDAIENEEYLEFMKALMLEEICPTLDYDSETVTAYAHSVIDRFSNPFIDHRWHNITLNFTQKMTFRNLASIERYYKKKNHVPHKMATCFAWYLQFMTPLEKNEDHKWYGIFNNKKYIINDPDTEKFFELQQQYQQEAYVDAVLQMEEPWNGFHFNKLPGFADAVKTSYMEIATTKRK
jgi:tagaturonate reductase